MYRPPPPPVAQSSSSSAYGQQPSLYPRVGQPSANPPSRTSSHHQNPSHSHHHTSSPATSSGLGIRFAIKPEYCITPPPLLSPHVGDIPRSTFQFDFDFERKILAEAEKDGQSWSKIGLEHLPSNTTESTSSAGSVTDPIVRKYIASGLSREAVPIAVENYGDNPTKVQEFVKGFTLLREMGFSSNNAAEALAMYDTDTDKALAHFLNSSS